MFTPRGALWTLVQSGLDLFRCSNTSSALLRRTFICYNIGIKHSSNMNKTTRIFIAFILLVGAGLALTILKKPPANSTSSPMPPSANAVTPTPGTITANDNVGKVEGASVSESGLYQHQNPTFEFKVPEWYSLGRIDEGEDGEALIVQSASATIAQIFISQYPANATLTPEQIKAEQPELEMVNAKPYSINGISGVYFENHVKQGWNIINVWFNKESHLFQATAYLENKQQLEAVLSSWKWLPE